MVPEVSRRGKWNLAAEYPKLLGRIAAVRSHEGHKVQIMSGVPNTRHFTGALALDDICYDGTKV
jgi:hypothetical protein